jgi:serine/threonine protein kinase
MPKGLWLRRRVAVQKPLKSMMGTVDFMAPEILRVPRRAEFSEDALYRAAVNGCPGFDLSADVWALGVTVYEALCGRRPWLSRSKVHPLPPCPDAIHEAAGR